MSEWQPIETGPKHGPDVLLSYDNCVHEGRYMMEARDRLPDGWYWSGYNKAVGPIFPTHWQDLPAPPNMVPQKGLDNES